MTNRVVWDKYETALLIDTFWEIEKSPSRKQELIKGLSEALRLKAINSGLTIDEKFRNVNGITMQLTPIAHAFFPDRPSLTSSKMFDQMVELYKTDRELFDKTLAIAKSMVTGDRGMSTSPNAQPSFPTWLAEMNYKKFNPQQLILALEDASKYALEHKLSVLPYSRITDPKQFSSIMSKVQGMRFFRFKHPRTSRYLDPAITLYRRYLQSLCDSKALTVSSVEASRDVGKYQSDTSASLPANESKQEETDKASFERNRNLFYVCCSRPKKRLILLITVPVDANFRSFLSTFVGTDNIYDYPSYINRIKSHG